MEKKDARVFVISDLHFGHKNVAIFRGFKDDEEQDELIILRWNEVVTKKDTVWILGDITMERTSHYYLLDRLNGIKNVVLGNHDKPQHIPELLKHVNKVCGCFSYHDFIFTHIPIHESELSRFRKNIHGHVHKSTLSDSRYVNVCCEALDYYPMLITK